MTGLSSNGHVDPVGTQLWRVRRTRMVHRFAEGREPTLGLTLQGRFCAPRAGHR